MDVSLISYRDVLMNEISLLKSRFQETDTGHLRTAVAVLEERVEELRKTIEAKLAA